MAQIVPNESVASVSGTVYLESGTNIPGEVGRVWEFIIMKGSVAEEQSLQMMLSRETKRAMGPGGFFQAAKGELQYLKDNNMNAEFRIAVEAFAQMTGGKASPSLDAVGEYRMSPAGVALEMFWRTRKTHAEVTLKDFQTIITDANAMNVFIQILDIVSDDKKST